MTTVSYKISDIKEYIYKTFNYERELGGSETDSALMSMEDIVFIIEEFITFEGSTTVRQKYRTFATVMRDAGFDVQFLEEFNSDEFGYCDANIKKIST